MFKEERQFPVWIRLVSLIFVMAACLTLGYIMGTGRLPFEHIPAEVIYW